MTASMRSVSHVCGMTVRGPICTALESPGWQVPTPSEGGVFLAVILLVILKSKQASTFPLAVIREVPLLLSKRCDQEQAVLGKRVCLLLYCVNAFLVGFL